MADHRRLIICCDGTWNRPDERHDGVPTPTNVRIFHNALVTGAASDPEQIPRYFSGVGADGHAWTRLIDGGTGHGLSANIRAAYLWLATTYQPGDLLSFVGFSRGAFTVRSLVGMIERCGLLDFETDSATWNSPKARAKAVEETFRRGYVPADPGAWQVARDEPGDPPLAFRAGLSPGDTRDRGQLIEFLGVWDTVGALGVPDFMAVANLFDNPKYTEFHNTDLPAEVGVARHAMALDERRGAFIPTPWTGLGADGEPELLPNDDEGRVKQLWFPGVHSDVGGGYAEHDLSDGALQWMLAEAAAAGLVFKDLDIDPPQLTPNPYGVLHDSCTGLYDHMSSSPRAVPRVDNDSPDSTIAPSAFQRWQGQPVRQDPYRLTTVLSAGESSTCEVRARVPWSETGLFLEAGTYTFTAEGDWSDRGIPGGPAGLQQPHEHPLHRLADAAGWIETLVRHLPHEDAAQFAGTKRWEKLDWFELVGMVAHGAATATLAGNTWAGPDGHQYIRIGAGVADINVIGDGYLYAFANDAWGAYDNNRGSVRLTVTRTS